MGRWREAPPHSLRASTGFCAAALRRAACRAAARYNGAHFDWDGPGLKATWTPISERRLELEEKI